LFSRLKRRLFIDKNAEFKRAKTDD